MGYMILGICFMVIGLAGVTKGTLIESGFVMAVGLFGAVLGGYLTFRKKANPFSRATPRKIRNWGLVAGVGVLGAYISQLTMTPLGSGLIPVFLVIFLWAGYRAHCLANPKKSRFQNVQQ